MYSTVTLQVHVRALHACIQLYSIVSHQSVTKELALRNDFQRILKRGEYTVYIHVHVCNVLCIHVQTMTVCMILIIHHNRIIIINHIAN
jgi:hypothetical protein